MSRMPNSWIFQANPAKFEIQKFLASAPSEFEWLVTRYGPKMGVGDRVFLWQSGSNAGVIAEARLVSGVRSVADPDALPFWLDLKSSPEAHQPRARLKLVRHANLKQIIRRKWLLEDPVFRDHLILRLPNSTNFTVDGAHLERLSHLWARVHSDWTYEDTVAGLWAFYRTLNGPVSKKPGSPVAIIAMNIGRPISGAYNKVMNFRSIDPSDPRKGFDGVTGLDRMVWSKFFDPVAGKLNGPLLEQEYASLFPEDRQFAFDEGASRADLEDAAAYLARSETLEDLLAAWAKAQSGKAKRPPRKVRQASTYERLAIVGAIARKRASFRCEVPGCAIPLFSDSDGQVYVEVHHIKTLATGGLDVPENVACLCPMHHREIHHGANGRAIAEQLAAIRKTELSKV